MPKFIKKHKLEFVVFFLAVAARLIFFLICLHVNGGNIENTIHGKDWYFEISRNLLLGNGFSAEQVPPFLPYSYGVPMYPLFLFFLLWLTGSYFATAMIQLLLGAFIPIIGMRLARLIAPSVHRAPPAVGILLALAPYQILFSFIFFTEVLFTVLFGIFLILFLKFLQTPLTRLAVLSGLFLGLSTLTKPTVQYVAILAIVFALWRFRSVLSKNILLQLGYFFLLFLMVLSPWVYRNYRTFHMLNISSQVSFNLSVTLLPSILAIDRNSSFREEKARQYLNPQDAMSGTSRNALIEILSHPVALMKLAVVSSVTFFTHDGMLTFLQAADIKPHTYLQKPALLMFMNAPLEFVGIIGGYMRTAMAFVFFARLFWIAVTVFFGLGLYHLWRSHLFSPQLLFCVIVVFYFMLTTMINGLTVNARFRMPVEPIIFAVACAGFVFSSERIRAKIHRRFFV